MEEPFENCPKLPLAVPAPKRRNVMRVRDFAPPQPHFWYAVATATAAADILENGIPGGSVFYRQMEDAIACGGSFVFAVHLGSSWQAKAPAPGQLWLSHRVAAGRIAALYHCARMPREEAGFDMLPAMLRGFDRDVPPEVPMPLSRPAPLSWLAKDEHTYDASGTTSPFIIPLV